ncbi:hypothetical protein O181_033143 [Austropuccinia psidii MF-1]|uniref:Uncharacterized protein n=1 Tax=Austropuccinia psidii MF-1 TaxID=1389203 RepID=A0A9Q3D0X1_9BASI|nr:hypothetical protein [Austropuccinia psidii MF-1]
MSFENDKYSVDKDPYKLCLRWSERLKAIDPQMNIQMRNHKLLTQIPAEPEHAVKCRCKQSCTIDEIENTLQYTIMEITVQNQRRNSMPTEQVPEQESPTEVSESDSMGDAIKEQSDEDQYLRE